MKTESCEEGDEEEVCGHLGNQSVHYPVLLAGTLTERDGWVQLAGPNPNAYNPPQYPPLFMPMIQFIDNRSFSEKTFLRWWLIGNLDTIKINVKIEHEAKDFD